jgi:hypothetical protein
MLISLFFKTEEEPNVFDYANLPVILSLFMFPTFGYDTATKTMNSTEIHTFIEKNEKFDVCIFEAFNIDSLLVRKKLEI